MVPCKLCPVCGHQPNFSPSMIRNAESVGCNWEEHCPENSFDFTTQYLPIDEAIAAWNAAVDAHIEKEASK